MAVSELVQKIFPDERNLARASTAKVRREVLKRWRDIAVKHGWGPTVDWHTVNRALGREV
jgi:hypothetical protein